METTASTTATTATAARPGPASEKLHQGSCHCGSIRFQVRFDAGAGGTRCNCSICTKTSIKGVLVKPAAFTLLSDPESPEMGRYVWGSKTGQRFFCKSCGIHCFGRGHLEQLGGDYVTVNLNAVDDVDAALLPTLYWDGRHDNWQAGPRPTAWPVVAAV